MTLVKRAFLKSMNNEETLVTKVLLGLRRCYVDYVITDHQVRGLRHPPIHDRQVVKYGADDIKSQN